MAVLMHFEFTPKALANSSPGFERSENPGYIKNKRFYTLKGFHARRTLSGFNAISILRTQGCRKRQPWAEIS